MYYKLTDGDMRTHGGFQWEQDRWYSIEKDVRGKGGLCGPGWFHCYDHPILAEILNSIHANIVYTVTSRPRLFHCSVRGRRKTDNGLKFGFTFMRLGEELPLPTVNTTQRLAFGILCAKQVVQDKKWRAWADGWLSGKDRSSASADVASRAAYAAYVAVAVAQAAYLADAVNKSAYVVWEAAYTSADATYATWEADVAWEVAYVAESVASAAEIDLKRLVRLAMEYD